MSGELTPAGGGDLATRRPAVPPSAEGPSSGWAPPPARPPDDEIDLREAWAILRRNWWLVAGCTLLGLLAAFAYVKLATPVYRSSTTLQFQERGSTVPVLDALRDLQGGTEVGTEMEVLRSRSLAEAVIDSLGLQVQVSGPRGTRRTAVLASVQADADAPESRVRLARGEDGRFAAELLESEDERLADAGDALGTAAPGEPLRLPGATIVLAPGAAELERLELEIRPRTMAAERFGEALGVSRPNRDANVVQVRFDAPDPGLARDVANVLAHQYLVRRNAVRKVSDRSTVDFLRNQVDTLQGQLRSAEEAVRRFREQNRVVNLEAEAQAQVERLAALQAQRAELEAEREALAGLLTDARAADGAGEGASPYRRLLAFPTLLRNQTTSTLLQALTVRETELSQLGARRTPADPDYQAVAGQLRELEDQATAVVTTYLGGLANQVEAIDRELAGFGERLAAVPAKEVEYARLERSARVLADIYTLLQTRLKEAEVVEAVEDASVRVVDVAVAQPRSITPRTRLALALAALIGLLAGSAAAIGREWADTSVRTREDLATATGLPVIGTIPRIPSITGVVHRAGRGSVTPHAKVAAPRLASRPLEDDSRGMVTEAYRTLRTNLAFARPGDPPRTIAFTSPSPEDGKSTTIANLAVALAQDGRRVLVMDADLRRGSLHGVFNGNREPGMAEVLIGQIQAPAAVQTIDFGQRGWIQFISTGHLPPDPAQLLGTGRLARALAMTETECDIVLVDTPPVNLVADAAIVGRQVDGVVIVARAGRTRRPQLRAAIEQLQRAQVAVIGVILNDADLRRDQRFPGQYSYEAYASSRPDRT